MNTLYFLSSSGRGGGARPLRPMDTPPDSWGTTLYHTYPSPVRAQHPCMCHGCSLTLVRLSCCDISAADIAPLISCLLANTNTAALRRSYKCTMLNIGYTTTTCYCQRIASTGTVEDDSHKYTNNAGVQYMCIQVYYTKIYMYTTFEINIKYNGFRYYFRSCKGTFLKMKMKNNCEYSKPRSTCTTSMTLSIKNQVCTLKGPTTPTKTSRKGHMFCCTRKWGRGGRTIARHTFLPCYIHLHNP